ncbi:diacylglycerol kinase family protein [Lacimicrobium sp. SS2-24]|uniref:diacylglycerol/lipid kinase family protein n=1 Tax=Lacimicrobium sp. SS2-24 TaxID=2005569 RepID=UPI000B4A8A7E|nr:diacylglycerol kinase family protein [Lacimicrobium sp. SS2-24]
MPDNSLPRHFLIIVNPLARAAAQSYRQRLTQRLTEAGIAFDIWHTTENYQANLRHLRQCQSHHTDWVVIGGDGTLNLAVNGAANSKVALGLLPCGSGNDFARSIYRKHDDAIEVVLGEHSRWIDLGKCNERFFINVLGLGFDGQLVADMYAHPPTIGRRWRYLAAALGKLLCYREQPLELSSAQRCIGEPAFMVAFANGRYFGGGMQIAPQAQLCDGMLDCCWIGRAPVLKKLYYLMRVFAGAHLHADAVQYWHDAHFEAATSGLPIEGDGEFFGTTPATIRCVKGALRFKLPEQHEACKS